MILSRLRTCLLPVGMLLCSTVGGQTLMHAPDGSLHLHVVSTEPGKQRAIPAAIWLTPQGSTPALPFTPKGRYTLLQKNRTFIPHLQVIPTGSSVQFPNDDPFFHNVFSLFDGKRFDLGLYEAGSSKSVTFSREGPSYIFCNIHPEMSAVVLALSTPLYAVADDRNEFLISAIPEGDYRLHFWIEGVPQHELDALSRSVHIESKTDIGDVKIAIAAGVKHANKFGNPYLPTPHDTY